MKNNFCIKLFFIFRENLSLYILFVNLVFVQLHILFILLKIFELNRQSSDINFITQNRATRKQSKIL